jgi:serine protease AprX
MGTRSVVWRSVGWRAHRRAITVAVLSAALLAAPALGIARADTAPTTRVIVTTSGGGTPTPAPPGGLLGGVLGPVVGAVTSIATTAVGAVQAQVVSTVPLIGGVVADVTPDQLAQLKSQPGVIVTPDLAVALAAAPVPAPTRAPAAVFPQTTGASTLVTQGNAGAGATVAVLDTGIDNLPDFAGRLVDGVDLSGEGNPFQDNYGHGTFVAGLIAGNGASSAGQYVGEAPGAGLVAIKVAGASGLTDMATVINGVGWAVANAAADHIGVLNLSLGVVPLTSTVLNPLDQAVEAAWRAGIVVVVSAGNAGPFNGTILSPGDDPLVITAGAVDDNGSTDPASATMTAFSSVGPTNPDGFFKPDLVTSGRSVVSLRAPGSTVDQGNPTARIGDANFVGSGTSFSAAITSGAAALVLAGSKAAIKPNSVKARLLGTTNPGPVGSPFVDGHGQLNVLAAAASHAGLSQVTPTVPTPVGANVSLQRTWAASSWNQARWSGLGLNLSLGSLLGGLGLTGSAWNGSAWNGSAWNGSAWNGSAWNGSAWNGSAWNGSGWNGSGWNGSAWNGSAWNGSAWNGSAWNGSGWNGSGWNGSAWN